MADQAPDVEVASTVTPKDPVSPLSATLGLTKERQDQQVLSWNDLACTVHRGTEHEREILHPMSGIARPGELVAVMGPSGAGKSCLLNALAGRSPGVSSTGMVRINGIETAPADRRARCGYVMQEDALLTTQTPTEVLNFAAALRLGMPDGPERESLVSATLEVLGLSKCSENPIGSTVEVSDKGRVSGGEKKRVAIAQELLSRPGIVFLDEPTSGLDSHNARKLIGMLRMLARDGCVVMCTIHQPSSEVFALFDRVMLLANGGLVYDGPTEHIDEFFAGHGIQMPEQTNPADFALMKLLELEKAELESMAEVRTDVRAPEPSHLPPRSEKRGSFCDALRLLIQRDLRHKIRERTSLVARFGSVIILNVLAGLLYLGVGREWGTDTDVQDINSKVNNHFGVIVFFTINTMMLNAQPPLIAFVPERPVFIREFASGAYGATPYALSKIIVEIPTVMLVVAVGLGIQTGLAGLQGNFGVLWSIYVTFAMASSSVSFVLGAATTTAEVALALLPLVMVPQILLAGFFVSSEAIPVWIRWLQWVCPMKYAVSLAMRTEFHTDVVPDDRELYTQNLLDRTDIETDTEALWLYIGVLLGMSLVLRVLSAIVLRRRATTSFGDDE